MKVGMLCIIGLILGGCSVHDDLARSASVVMLEGSAAYPPTQSVQILMQRPSRAFKEIALLEVDGMFRTPDLLEGLRRRAARIGADAIVLLEKENMQEQDQAQLFYNPLVTRLGFIRPWAAERQRLPPSERLQFGISIK
jgi:hypothetical protein